MILTVIVVSTPHWPGSGKNVYSKFPGVRVSIEEGDQEPVIPFVEIPGNIAGFEFWQSGPIRLK